MNLLNLLKDVIWMMGVTITNLGYGDFTPRNNSALIPLSNFECRINFFEFSGKRKELRYSFWLSRVITSILSLSGIFQTALIVGVLRKWSIKPFNLNGTESVSVNIAQPRGI